ncbi:Protein CNGC15c [Camellia lanceoleosa]|uniref:Protein CNGC15c n=1 Tax=Camellia lanceoleosa TaxID=1840588 RepID=A0ACC0F289_9ERIC|nr:Protein CNGC15c [Camellia lanceoleosa]
MASYSQFGFHCTADQTLLLTPRSIFRSHASMTCSNSISVRFQDDLEISKLPKTNGDKVIKVTYKIDGSQILEPSSRRAKETGKTRKSLKARILSRVFSEDYERVNRKILDPREPAIRRWNKIFLVASLVSLFVDPLFFYLPKVQDNICVDMGSTLEVMLTIIRSIADMFYIIQIYVRFCTAYVAPSSRVFGRGELVIDYSKIVSRYLRKRFWIDVIAALPLPQVLIWLVIPNLRGSTMANTKGVLRFIIIFQYLPRLFLIFTLSSQIVQATGIVTKRAWQGAAYNLMLYMLASHVLGASWYLLSIERQEACWISACKLEKGSCQSAFFDCRRVNDPDRNTWFQSTNITNVCDPNSSSYPFGIYSDAIKSNVTSSMFFNKYFYCLWWGLNNLSSLGQNLSPSINVEEISFAIIIANLGLVLFALLIGNMQTYLQSTTARLEEWRIKRTDTEQWMHHRQLPPELRQAVRKYDQYKWVATRGVDEEALLKDLPLDLRRDIKRHLCLDLVRRVPLFDQMDEKMLDAICERLKPGLSTQGMCLVREGDPVDEMLFIIRGNLDSNTTNGGRTGFFSSCSIGPGDFCGEELLTWALDPHLSIRLPSSTRTVKAISEVETFALRAEDLKFVALQFRRLHSKKLRHKFRFYSHQWRLWAACFVQVVWRHYRRRKIAAERKAKEYLMPDESELLGGPLELDVALCSSSLAVMAARLAANTRRGVKNLSGLDSSVVSSLKKPEEPDFSCG